MVGLADRLSKGQISDTDAFILAYDKLLADDKFKDAYTRSTADEEKVRLRIGLARDAFSILS
jgi:fructose-specific phosphotransferase system component IIB